MLLLFFPLSLSLSLSKCVNRECFPGASSGVLEIKSDFDLFDFAAFEKTMLYQLAFSTGLIMCRRGRSVEFQKSSKLCA
jgi:hypothetical protein